MYKKFKKVSFFNTHAEKMIHQRKLLVFVITSSFLVIVFMSSSVFGQSTSGFIKFEAESGTLVPSAVQSTDSLASGGSYVRFNDPSSSGSTLTIDDAAYDMFGPVYRNDGRFKDGIKLGDAPWGRHEAFPVGGNTSWDWYHGVRFGENPPWNNFMIPWGQLFAAPGNDVWNVRLQVASVEFWVLINNKWQKVKPDVAGDVKMDGGFWDSTFAGQGATDAEKGIRSEGSNQGWSVRLATMETKKNYVTWHWFYSAGFYPRPPVPAGTQAVFQAARMRLVQDTGSVNLNNAKFIASFGSDHWPAGTGGKPDGKQITPFMQPRMKYVTPEWQWFTGHVFTGWFNGSTPNASAMNDSLIRQYPPPIIGQNQAP